MLLHGAPARARSNSGYCTRSDFFTSDREGILLLLDGFCENYRGFSSMIPALRRFAERLEGRGVEPQRKHEGGGFVGLRLPDQA
jgi:hypothetical protein